MSTHGHQETVHKKLYGLIAEFDDPDELVNAASKTYEAGYRNFDAYSPFPIHGLAESMGMKKTPIPLITLLGGIAGAFAGFSMQYFASVIHYPVDVGGTPFMSWPAFIPITFELTILFGAFAAFGSMLVLNGLPQHYHPVFSAKRFERASSDGFFLCIEVTDDQYDDDKTRQFLETFHPVEVSEVQEEIDEAYAA
jgi:hypothetical protein